MEVWSPKLGNGVIKATCTAFLHHPYVSVLGNTLLIACSTVSYSLSSQGGQCTAVWSLSCSVPTDTRLCVSEIHYFTAFPKLPIINVPGHMQWGLVQLPKSPFKCGKPAREKMNEYSGFGTQTGSVELSELSIFKDRHPQIQLNKKKNKNPQHVC